MAKNGEGEMVRTASEQIPATSSEDLARMLAIPDEAIDFSDIAERTNRRPLKRDGEGRLAGHRSLIREAILVAMTERGWTTHALWNEANALCPTLSETVVGDFLKGQRSIGLESLEALMGALELVVTSRNPREHSPLL